MIKPALARALQAGLLSLTFLGIVQAQPQTPQIGSKLTGLPEQDYAWIGERIYQNECAGQTRYLTHWGKGEAFPSFGIAHFIWFPKGVDAPFEETFPALFDFLMKTSTPQTSAPPSWLASLWSQNGAQTAGFDAPWQSKIQFEQAGSSPEMAALRDWLSQTRREQAEFVVQSFHTRWQQTVQTKAQAEQQSLQQKLSRLMQFKAGTFAIVDYFNFKGIGGNDKEQYQGVGWGLIEVLQQMPAALFNQPDNVLLLQGFVESAKQRLQTRVDLAPAERAESRWLAGWFKRLDGYLNE
ncbi:hypothetical protein [Thiomicrorhabdus cannonii]|uniref:hypothetical protein n=1 Tax=Thiomicrorhabdus cannonii TaxID=2748011 RepID=UPI0015BDEC7C|nr:hypothetical protein [Thiomicrorhabdus cannonii]